MGKSKIIYFFFILILAACSQSRAVFAEVNSFEECVNAGNPIRKSLPAQCVSKEGKVFIDSKTLLQPPPLQDTEKICKDLCGDGQCAEMVCMGTGCPCAESPENCPKDCK